MVNFLLFFNISGGELLIIILVVYLVFGPKKIPELARTLGKGINELRRASNEVRNEITREVTKIKKEVDVFDDDDIRKPKQKTKTSEPSHKDEK